MFHMQDTSILVISRILLQQGWRFTSTPIREARKQLEVRLDSERRWSRVVEDRRGVRLCRDEANRRIYAEGFARSW